MAENAVQIGSTSYQSAPTSTGTNTPTVDYTFMRKDFGIYVTTAGSPATTSIQAQGSFDGTNFFNLGSAITAAGYSTILNSPTRFLRFAVTLTGGTNPTATVEAGAI